MRACGCERGAGFEDDASFFPMEEPACGSTGGDGREDDDPAFLDEELPPRVEDNDPAFPLKELPPHPVLLVRFDIVVGCQYELDVVDCGSVFDLLATFGKGRFVDRRSKSEQVSYSIHRQRMFAARGSPTCDTR